MFVLNKFSLVILTRCNLACKLCCEYVPQNKPFPDMTVAEAERILEAAFSVADRITTLHLTGGGEPFLHPNLAQLIEAAMKYADQFDRLMLFTNSTVPVSDELLGAICRYKEKIVVQLSLYHQRPRQEQDTLRRFQEAGIHCKVEKYYGDDQSFGGWIDFGPWEAYNCTAQELEEIFHECSVTRVMEGNWRTRDGKVHWCTRSMRGMELGYVPDNPDDYVDLFGGGTREEKQAKFMEIAKRRYISACDRCSGDLATLAREKRHPAGEQMERTNGKR